MLPDWLKQLAAECTEEERASLRINPHRSRTMSSWIPVSERVPSEADGMVLTFCPERGYWIDHILANGSWAEDVKYYCGGVTHWMPLPERPKEQQHERR